MTSIEVTMIDGKPVVFLPPEVAARLRVEHGGEIQIEDGPDGVALHRMENPVASQLEIAAKVMREDREVLSKLAE